MNMIDLLSTTSSVNELECVTVPFGKVFDPEHLYIPSLLFVSEVIVRTLIVVLLTID